MDRFDRGLEGAVAGREVKAWLLRLRASARVLIAAFCTTPIVITVVGLGSLAILLVKILWLNSMPELFPRAEVLGELMENILTATFAAYLFFVISYQAPQVIERHRVGPAIVRLGKRVVQDVRIIYTSVNEQRAEQRGVVADEVRADDVTLEMIRECFRSVSPNETSRLMVSITSKRVTWFEALVTYRNKFCEQIDKIWRYSRFIDPELAALLDGLEYSQFATTMNMFRDYAADGRAFANRTLEAWAAQYFDCYQKARALAKYFDGYARRYGLQ